MTYHRYETHRARLRTASHEIQWVLVQSIFENPRLLRDALRVVDPSRNHYRSGKTQIIGMNTIRENPSRATRYQLINGDLQKRKCLVKRK
jgi:hypothetical protein